MSRLNTMKLLSWTLLTCHWQFLHYLIPYDDNDRVCPKMSEFKLLLSHGLFIGMTQLTRFIQGFRFPSYIKARYVSFNIFKALWLEPHLILTQPVHSLLSCPHCWWSVPLHSALLQITVCYCSLMYKYMILDKNILSVFIVPIPTLNRCASQYMAWTYGIHYIPP